MALRHDLALDDDGLHSHVFVSNVLNGTVSRLDVAVESGDLKLLKKTTIASGYKHVPNLHPVMQSVLHDHLQIAIQALDNQVFPDSGPLPYIAGPLRA